MSAKYEELLKKHCPVDTIIEDYVSYYGEDHRKYIESKIKGTEVIFVPDLASSYDAIKQAFKKLYNNETTLSWEDMASQYIRNIKLLTDENSIQDCDLNLLAQHSKVLQEIGFDIKKILLKHKVTGVLKLNTKSDETNRLTNFLNFAIDKKKIDTNVIDLDGFVEMYNKMADRKVYVEPKPSRNANKLWLMAMGAEKDLNGYNVDFPKMENLTRQDKKFLNGIIKAKDPFLSRNDEQVQYVLKGINRIFKKDFKTIEEIEKDPSMLIFRAFRTDASRELADFIMRENTVVSDYVKSKESERWYHYGDANLCSQEGALGYYEDRGDYRFMCMKDIKEYSYAVVMHEFNHCLSKDQSGVKDFNRDSVGFNEIVTEFLTKQMLKKKSKATMEGCAYDGGIELLGNFLTKFESKIKECQFGNAPQILEDFIGKENYKNLINYANLIERKNYGQFAVSIEVKNAVKTGTIISWLKTYKKYPQILQDTQESFKSDVSEFVKYDKFITDLVEHYNEFEKGNIVSIPLAEVDKTEQEETTLNG